MIEKNKATYLVVDVPVPPLSAYELLMLRLSYTNSVVRDCAKALHRSRMSILANSVNLV